MSNRMKSNISGMETNMEQLLEKASLTLIYTVLDDFAQIIIKRKE